MCSVHSRMGGRGYLEYRILNIFISKYHSMNGQV